MVIIKHGYCYNDKKTHVGLLGNCRCGCHFTTYVNIYHNSDAVTFIKDKDCPDINIKLDDSSNIRYIKYSCFCPECRSNVELIPRVEGDNDRKI